MSFVTNKSLKVALEGVKSELDKNLPTKVSQLENDSQYITEENIYTREQIGWLLDSINSSLDAKANKSELSNKVDKVNGKQLSTNDFTTELKNKLNSLVNYDDTDIKERIDEVTERLNILIGNDDVSAVIDTFNEIEDFLSGITNKETLTGLLQDLKSEIVALCANSYVSLNKTENIGGNKTFTSNVGIYKTSPRENFYTDVEGVKTNRGHVGVDENGIYIYNDISKKHLRIKDDGTLCYPSSKIVLTEDNYSSTIFKGTSSQFLKADGSVDSKEYLPTSGGTIKGDVTFENGLPHIKSNNINGGNARTYYLDNNDGTLQGGFGAYWSNGEYGYHYVGWGESPWVFGNNLSIGPDRFTYKNNQVWHAGNFTPSNYLPKSGGVISGNITSEITGGFAYKCSSDSGTNDTAED